MYMASYRYVACVFLALQVMAAVLKTIWVFMRAFQHSLIGFETPCVNTSSLMKWTWGEFIVLLGLYPKNSDIRTPISCPSPSFHFITSTGHLHFANHHHFITVTSHSIKSLT